VNQKQERKARRDISLENLFLKLQALIDELVEKYPELGKREGKDSDRELPE